LLNQDSSVVFSDNSIDVNTSDSSDYYETEHILGNQHLSACLPLIAPKETTGSLAVQDEFNKIDYQNFLLMFKDVEELAEIGSESFLSVFLNLKNTNTNLSKEILDLLVEYYCNAYDRDFAALSDIHVTSPNVIWYF
ncbi:15750_t:CDS:2, partial [Funneliformis mosseae]